jgi:hypothetical protein
MIIDFGNDKWRSINILTSRERSKMTGHPGNPEVKPAFHGVDGGLMISDGSPAGVFSDNGFTDQGNGSID